MSTRIQDLNPEVLDDAIEAINELKEKKIPYVVTSTTRTALEQYCFYLQSRVGLEYVNLLRRYLGLRMLTSQENINPVTLNDGIVRMSNHQSGRALDVVPADENGNSLWPGRSDPRWKQISSVMKKHGFQWGGDWAVYPDYPHYEKLK